MAGHCRSATARGLPHLGRVGLVRRTSGAGRSGNARAIPVPADHRRRLDDPCIRSLPSPPGPRDGAFFVEANPEPHCLDPRGPKQSLRAASVVGIGLHPDSASRTPARRGVGSAAAPDCRATHPKEVPSCSSRTTASRQTQATWPTRWGLGGPTPHQAGCSGAWRQRGSSASHRTRERSSPRRGSTAPGGSSGVTGSSRRPEASRGDP